MSQNQLPIGVNEYIWQILIVFSMNNAREFQEGDAWKQTNLKIWIHLSQKFHLTIFDLLTDFLLLRVHKKEDDITSFSYLNFMQLRSHKFGPN